MKQCRILFALFIGAFLILSAVGQDKSKVKQKRIPYIEVVDCFRCNDLVISLPNPEYPSYVGYGPHAYNGKIAVQIVIDENGKVEKATGVSGHPYFRPMLEKESLKATFKPRLVNGKPVKNFGVIVFLVASKAAKPNQTVSKMERNRKPTVISCGVCIQKAILLPQPEYPSAGTFVNASGKVSVQILIDEKGSVMSAKAVSGHPLLRSASEKAALKAKFEPFLLGKKHFRVVSTIIYDFALDRSPSSDVQTDESKRKLPIVNGMANYLPSPNYPEQARLNCGDGKVEVEVLI